MTTTDTTLMFDQMAIIERECAAVARVLGQNPGRHFLCDADRPVPGLPVLRLSDKPDMARGRYPTDRGDARPCWNADLHDTRYDVPGTPWYEIRYPTAPLPAAVAPVPGVAVVDLAGRAQVWVAEDWPTGEPVWFGQIGLDGKRGADFYLTLRARLAADGIPVIPGQVRVQVADYPYPDLSVPTLSNEQIGVSLAGYAVDPDTQHLIYAHLVGHKTALQSVWGSLVVHENRQKPLSLTAGGQASTVHSTRHYRKAPGAPLNGDTGMQHMLIVDRRCVEETADRAYLLLPQRGDLEAATAFAVRLQSLIPLPLPLEWGAMLREAGAREGLVKPCTCGGDAQAWVIDPGLPALPEAKEQKPAKSAKGKEAAEAPAPNGPERLAQSRWLEIINQLLTTGQLEIPTDKATDTEVR